MNDVGNLPNRDYFNSLWVAVVTMYDSGGGNSLKESLCRDTRVLERIIYRLFELQQIDERTRQFLIRQKGKAAQRATRP